MLVNTTVTFKSYFKLFHQKHLNLDKGMGSYVYFFKKKSLNSFHLCVCVCVCACKTLSPCLFYLVMHLIQQMGHKLKKKSAFSYFCHGFIDKGNGTV